MSHRQKLCDKEELLGFCDHKHGLFPAVFPVITWGRGVATLMWLINEADESDLHVTNKHGAF